MQSIQRGLLKSLWMNQKSLIKSPGRAVNTLKIIKAGKVWAERRNVTTSDQNKAISGANAGEEFNNIAFDCC